MPFVVAFEFLRRCRAVGPADAYSIGESLSVLIVQRCVIGGRIRGRARNESGADA
jgi:hypothetical protein